jgi:ketosteroid isomerase-like protein
MNRWLPLICLLSLPAPAFSAPPADSEAELRQREQEWNMAIQRHDAATAARFMSDSYALVVGIEAQKIIAVPRANWLETLDKLYRIESWKIDDVRTTVLGDTAVVVLLYTQKATIGGADRSGQFVLTDIWVKQAGQWRVTERVSSRPSAPMPAKPEGSLHK